MAVPAGEAGAGRDRMGDRSQEDALGPMVEGLATALQCYQDRMGEHMVSLVNEQAALLAKLDAARQALPLRPYVYSRDRERTKADDDIEYVSKVMSQAPWYTHRVHALTAQKASLAARVANLQRRSAGLRESLPVPLQRQMASDMALITSGLSPFREERDMAFVVCYQGGVAIRMAPNVDAPCTGDVLQWNEAISASERLGRLGEDTIYVKLRDGRGWVFEGLNGRAVLERVTTSSMGLPTPPRADRAGFQAETEGNDAASRGEVKAADGAIG